MGERITLQNLIDLFIEKSNLPKNEGDLFVRSFFVLIEKGLAKDGYVKIKGLGSFKLVKVEDRESVNVNTGERFLIEGHTKISFVPDASVRDLINKPFGHFETVILNDGVEFDDLLSEEEEVTEIVVVEETQGGIEIEVDLPEEKEPELPPAEQEEPALEEEEVKNVVEEKIEETSEMEEPAPVVVEEPVAIIEENTDKEELRDTGVLDTPQVVPSEKRRWVWVLPFMLILIGVIAVLFFFFDLKFDISPQPVSPEIVAVTEAEPVSEDFIAGSDTLVTEVTDSILVEQEIAEEEVIREEVAPAPVVVKQEPAPQPEPENKVYAENKKYTISGTKATHTVQQGERLTVIALKYYGTKKLWPYIVEHNKGVITNPDVVPYGTVIKIPELK